MNEIDKKLYKYLGDKTLSFGCKVIDNDGYDAICVGDTNMHTILDDQGYLVRDVPDEKVGIMKILGHEPTIADLHKWMNLGLNNWTQFTLSIQIYCHGENKLKQIIAYESYIPLMQQSDTTKEAIIKLIEKYGNN